MEITGEAAAVPLPLVVGALAVVLVSPPEEDADRVSSETGESS